MMKKQSNVPSTTSSSLSTHKNSQIISKVKPKIRIIHIHAPEIIKTDVANFRELVQRLTGKPTESSYSKKRPRIPSREEDQTNEPLVMMSKRTELRTGFLSPEFRERTKGEGRMWGTGENPSNYGGFVDLDGLMQEVNGFPLIPLDDFPLGERDNLLS